MKKGNLKNEERNSKKAQNIIKINCENKNKYLIIFLYYDFHRL